MKAGLVASGNLPRRRLRLVCDARGHSLEGWWEPPSPRPLLIPIGAGAPVPSLNTERRPSRHHGAADEGHAMMARGLPRSPRPDLGPALLIPSSSSLYPISGLRFLARSFNSIDAGGGICRLADDQKLQQRFGDVEQADGFGRRDGYDRRLGGLAARPCSHGEGRPCGAVADGAGREAELIARWRGNHLRMVLTTLPR